MEKSLGLPISPMCDRTNPTLIKTQKGFVSFVVKPIFESLSGYSSAVAKAVGQTCDGMQLALDNLESNMAFLTKVMHVFVCLQLFWVDILPTWACSLLFFRLRPVCLLRSQLPCGSQVTCRWRRYAQSWMAPTLEIRPFPLLPPRPLLRP